MFELLNNVPGDLVLMAILAIVSPLLLWLTYLILLYGFDRQRTAEIPRIITWRMAAFLVLCTIRIAAKHYLPRENEIEIYLSEIIQAFLDILLGLFLWLIFVAVLNILRYEFFERKFRKYGKDRERNTATILYGILRILAFVLILLFVAWLFDLNLAGYIITFGGLSVAVGFALQKFVQNIISGISLSLDAPFSTNDLIKVGNDQIYQVINRGIRVTTVKDIATHEIAYFPNNKLAEEVLVDVTRPTDDSRIVIDLGIGYDARIREIRQILLSIAHGHPHIIGPFAEKEKAINDKIFRLYVRHTLPNECFEHFVELTRLEKEHELNSSVLELKRFLEEIARGVDRMESRGFDKEEREILKDWSEKLGELAHKVIELTTEWQILIRNCTAKGKVMPDTSSAWKGDSDNNEEIKMSENLHDKMKELTAYLEKELENVSPYLDLKWEEELDEAKDFVDKVDIYNKAIRKTLDTIRKANFLSEKFAIDPETTYNRGIYDKKIDEKNLFKDKIQQTYNKMGEAYGKVLKKGTKLLSGAGFSIIECRTRDEDLYLSEEATEDILNNKICTYGAGEITDDDERSDLAEMMRVWGDKSHELLKKAGIIQSKLLRAKSTTIDTELRKFAEWLKKDFKDPFPSWKYPIAPVEGFDEFSIHLAIKMYVDNVRMEKYLRPFNTKTQFRLRIIERLGNEGIKIPFPRRDIKILDEETDDRKGKRNFT